MSIYETDKFARFDSLNTRPEYRAVKLDSLYTEATGTIWVEVAL